MLANSVGADPERPGWKAATALDARAFRLDGARGAHFSNERAPLESSVRGVSAVGDVRSETGQARRWRDRRRRRRQ